MTSVRAVANSANGATAVSEFATALDGTDLVPGNTRAVTAIADGLGQTVASLADANNAMTRSAGRLDWSGPAADAFDQHRRALVAVLDRWSDAQHAVRQAVTDHQTALAMAQDEATQALAVWRNARQQAGEAARWDNEGNAVAANADLLRTQVRTQFVAATQHAHALLRQARTELADAGNRTAETVRAALRTVRDARLPDLNRHVHGLSAKDRPHPTWSGQTATVQPPRDGVHDTLSRIAQRTLGDARRWPEIYQLNVGHQVGPHAVLHNPNLIQPGWTLRLPASPAIPPPALNGSPSPVVLPPVSGPPPAGLPGAGHVTLPPPQPFHPLPTPAVHTTHVGGIDLGGGLLLAGGVTAALAGIAVAAGVRRRRNPYHSVAPDSGPGPVVRQLTTDLAEIRTATDPDDEPTSVPDTGVPLGLREGHTVLVDAAATFGVGLTGPGAVAAVRAMLVSTLTTHDNSTAILSIQDARRLLRSKATPQETTPVPTPGDDARITIAPSRDAVFDHVESEILTRTRLLEETDGECAPAPLAVITTKPADLNRAQAIADLGVGLGIIVIVLGPWPAGLTCHITTDGQIDAADGPDWTASLIGLQVFTARADATRELLALLRPRRSSPPPSPAPITATPSSPTEDPIARSLSTETDLANVPSDIPARLAPTTAASTPAPRRPDSPTSAPAQPIHITVLGRLHVQYQPSAKDPVDITKPLAPKQRDILVYLALHPDGVRRETLGAALWPDAPPDRPYNSFHATLSQMRRAVRAATNNDVDSVVHQEDGYYTLDHNVVDVDLWHLNDALHTSRHTPHERERTAAHHHVAELYHGDLAEGISADWLDTMRESLRRDVLDSLATLIRSLRDQNPEQTLSLLEQARTLDRHNEAIYRDIIRTQARLGHHDAITRTLVLLDTAMAEIGSTASAETRALAVELLRRGSRAGAPQT